MGPTRYGSEWLSNWWRVFAILESFNGADPLWVGMVLMMERDTVRFACFNGADPLWVGMGARNE